MSVVTTSQRVDAARLSVELGGVPVTARTRGTVTEVEADVAEATLQTAVDAHVWVDGDANEQTQRDTVAARLDDLRGFANGNGNLSTAQLTAAVRVLARVVLRLALIVLGVRDRAD